MAVDDLRGVAGRYRVRLDFLHLCGAADFARFGELARTHPGLGVVVPLHFLFFERRTEMVSNLAAARIAAIYPRKYFLAAGAAAVLTPQVPEGSKRSYEIVAQVLRGRAPASIPVEVPTGFELFLSVGAAQRSGLVPSRLGLRRAREISP